MILSGEVIVMMALERFDSKIQSTSYTIAQELAKTNQVFYIDNPFTINDYYKLKGTTSFNSRKLLFFNSFDNVLDSKINSLKVIISPIILSLHFLPEGKIYRQLLKLNEWFIGRRIGKVLAKRSIKKFIYINSANFHYPNLAKYFDATLNVYHCVDPVFTDYDVKHGLISEKILVAKSDLIICTSRQLLEEKIVQNKNTYYVPNAADIENSSKALDDDLPIHATLKNIQKPIIGYFGAIERRIDYDLLKEVVIKKPELSFVFVGPVFAGCVPRWFYNQSNLYLIGSQPYDAMPAIVKGFDVAIIPFKKDEVSRTIFPLKLFEYLGAGKPVVTTNFNTDLAEFTGDSVSFCEDSDAFIKAINKELAENSIIKINKRLNIAAENTWLKRATEISALLAEYVNGYRKP